MYKDTSNYYSKTRLSRLRQTKSLRNLVKETILSSSDLIYPLFVKQDNGIKTPIKSMPGVFQLGLADLAEEVREIVKLKIPGVILFGIPNHKDEVASSSIQDNGIIQQAIRIIKDTAPDLLVIADVCCCEYTSHGHCGIIQEYKNNKLLNNDATLEIIQNQAISFANSGADIVAPSGMIDGQVKAIRYALDQEQFDRTLILSYAVKYASSFYGPFREAAEGTPKYGNRKTYQMDPANGNEALREAGVDIAEGADMIMVKPAQNYLDVIYRVKQKWPEVPLAAYQVSGEYSALKAAIANGWLDESCILESLTSIKRAKSDIIITYFAKEIANIL